MRKTCGYCKQEICNCGADEYAYDSFPTPYVSARNSKNASGFWKDVKYIVVTVIMFGVLWYALYGFARMAFLDAVP